MFRISRPWSRLMRGTSRSGEHPADRQVGVEGRPDGDVLPSGAGLPSDDRPGPGVVPERRLVRDPGLVRVAQSRPVEGEQLVEDGEPEQVGSGGGAARRRSGSGDDGAVATVPSAPRAAAWPTVSTPLSTSRKPAVGVAGGPVSRTSPRPSLFRSKPEAESPTTPRTTILCRGRAPKAAAPSRVTVPDQVLCPGQVQQCPVVRPPEAVDRQRLGDGGGTEPGDSSGGWVPTMVGADVAQGERVGDLRPRRR